MCPLQQGLAEFRVAQPRFLDSGEQVEGTLGAYQAEIGNFFDAVRRVKNAVPIGGYIILADVLTNRQRLDGCPLGNGGRGVNKAVIHIVHGPQQLRLGNNGTDPPAGHQEVL